MTMIRLAARVLPNQFLWFKTGIQYLIRILSKNLPKICSRFAVIKLFIGFTAIVFQTEILSSLSDWPILSQLWFDWLRAPFSWHQLETQSEDKWFLKRQKANDAYSNKYWNSSPLKLRFNPYVSWSDRWLQWIYNCYWYIYWNTRLEHWKSASVFQTSEKTDSIFVSRIKNTG